MDRSRLCQPGYAGLSLSQAFARHNKFGTFPVPMTLLNRNTNKPAAAMTTKRAAAEQGESEQKIKKETMMTLKCAAVEQAKAEDAVPSKVQHAAPSKSVKAGAAVRI